MWGLSDNSWKYACGGGGGKSNISHVSECSHTPHDCRTSDLNSVFGDALLIPEVNGRQQTRDSDSGEGLYSYRVGKKTSMLMSI